jgi:isoquinoline 1-oxidoreductase alpha subunit
MRMRLNVNGQVREIDTDPDKPLLWVLREELGLTGTKYGCGVAACGACTVHLDGEAVRSCVMPVEAAQDREVSTIEAVAAQDDMGSRVRQAWIDIQVPQCGYCQSGMIMAVTALLKASPAPSDDEIDAAITNICRCGTYPRIRKAIHAIARGTEAAS